MAQRNNKPVPSRRVNGFSVLGESVDPFKDVKGNSFGSEVNHGFNGSDNSPRGSDTSLEIPNSCSSDAGVSPRSNEGEWVTQKKNMSRRGIPDNNSQKSTSSRGIPNNKSAEQKRQESIKFLHKQRSRKIHNHILQVLLGLIEGRLEAYEAFLRKISREEETGSPDVILNELYAVGIECLIKNSPEYPELVDLFEQVLARGLTSRSDASSKWSMYNIPMWLGPLPPADYEVIARIFRIIHRHGCDIFQGNYKEDVNNNNKKETPLASLEAAKNSDRLGLLPNDIRERRRLFLTDITNYQLLTVVRQWNKLGNGEPNDEIFAQLRFAFTYRPAFTLQQSVVDLIQSIGEGKHPIATLPSPAKPRIIVMCRIIESCSQNTPTPITYLASYFATAPTLPIAEYITLVINAIVNYTYTPDATLDTGSPEDMEHELNRERSMLDARAYVLGVISKFYPTQGFNAMHAFVIQTLTELPDDDTKIQHLVSRAIRCIFAAEAFKDQEIIAAIDSVRERVDRMRSKISTKMLIEEYDRKINRTSPVTVCTTPVQTTKLTLIPRNNIDPGTAAFELGDAIEYHMQRDVSTATIAATFFEQLATRKVPMKAIEPMVTQLCGMIPHVIILGAYNEQMNRQNDPEDSEYQIEYVGCVVAMDNARKVLVKQGIM